MKQNIILTLLMSPLIYVMIWNIQQDANDVIAWIALVIISGHIVLLWLAKPLLRLLGDKEEE